MIVHARSSSVVAIAVASAVVVVVVVVVVAVPIGQQCLLCRMGTSQCLIPRVCHSSSNDTINVVHVFAIATVAVALARRTVPTNMNNACAGAATVTVATAIVVTRTADARDDTLLWLDGWSHYL